MNAVILMTALLSSDLFAASPDCIVLLAGPPQNAATLDLAVKTLADHSSGPKVFGIGAIVEVNLLMKILGHRERDVTSNTRAMEAVFKMFVNENRQGYPNLARAARKLYAMRWDSASLLACLLGPDCKFDIGKDAHLFFSSSVLIQPTDETRHGTQTHEANLAGALQLPDPVHMIVVHHKSITSADVVVTLFHEASHVEVTSLTFDWAHKHADEIRQGDRRGPRTFVTATDGSLYLDEGFMMTLVESQASLAELDLRRLIHASNATEEKVAGSLIELLRSMPPAAAFLSQQGLNERNIFAWSRELIGQIQK